MAHKSVVQRIVEAIAIVMVAVIAVPVVITIGSQLWPKRAAPAKTPASGSGVPLPPSPVAGPEPQRQGVDSVDKLPATYPGITELVMLADPPLPPDEELPAAEAQALENVAVRHLNAYVHGEARLSPGDPTIAVVQELTPAGTVRLAVWNVESGKLLRFLSSEVGKASRPYAGQENADFGTQVDLKNVQRTVFSPSGKRFAVRLSASLFEEGVTACVWDVPSGKLLSQYEEASRPLDVFDFASDEHLVLDVAYGQRETPVTLRDSAGAIALRQADRALFRIVVRTGDAELLAPVGFGANSSGQNAVRDGLIAFCGPHELHTIDVASRQHTQGEALTGRNPFRYQQMWFSRDGTKVYGASASGKLDAWDMATRQPVETWQLVKPNNGGGWTMLPAVGAGLVVAQQDQNRNASVFDLATGKLVSVVQLPFSKGRVKAISSDARRLLLGTDQQSLLVVDFPQALPTGVIDLGHLLGKMKLPAAR